MDRGVKRAQPTAAARARDVRKAARLAAAPVFPSQEDRDNKDEMRGVSAVNERAVGVNQQPFPGPMVQFTAPPAPPLVDPSLFLSGSLAGATNLQPLSNFNDGFQYSQPHFAGAHGFAGAVPGASFYSPPFVGAPGFPGPSPGLPSSGMPAASLPAMGLPHPSYVPVNATSDGLPPPAPTSAALPLPLPTGTPSASVALTASTAPLSTPLPLPTGAPGAAGTLAATTAPMPTPLGEPLTAASTPQTPPTLPNPPAPTTTPTIPPALVRGGRRAGAPRRPRFASASAATTARAGAARAPEVAGEATRATTVAALAPAVSAATAAASAGPAAAFSAAAPDPKAVRKPGGKRLNQRRTTPEEDSDEEVHVVAPRAPTGAVVTPTTGGVEERPGTVTPTQTENGGDDDAKTMKEFIKTAKELISHVGFLSKDVRRLNKRVEAQAHSMENMAVSVGKVSKSGVAPTGLVSDVDGEEDEYSDYEEMRAFIVTGLVGAAIPATTSAVARANGRRLTVLQEGTLRMLRVRRRVKIRTYGRVGGATSTCNVMHDSEADWALMVEETKGELNMDERQANEFLLSTISSSVTRKTRAKGKGKLRPREVRAYQPILQSVAHALEEIKKKAVSAWLKAVKGNDEKLPASKATEWLSNCRADVGGQDLVKPLFEASENGISGIVAAVKAIFVCLGVKDRISEASNVGGGERIMTSLGHVALAACFVRSELETMESGGSIRRTGADGGWYDRWRWELLALKTFVPLSRTPWHGLVIDDAMNSNLFVFSQAPVPFSTTCSRTLAALSTAMAAAVAAADAAAEAAALPAELLEPAAGVGAAEAVAAAEAAPEAGGAPAAPGAAAI